MFERFSIETRWVITFAQAEARRLHHGHVGTEHLILGIVQNRGLVGEALRSMGLSVETVRSRIDDRMGEVQPRPIGHIPLSPHATDALAYAEARASDVGAPFVEPEHMLFAIFNLGEGKGRQVLDDLGPLLPHLLVRVELVVSQGLPETILADNRLEASELDAEREPMTVVGFARRGLSDITYVMNILRASAFDTRNDPRHRRLLEGFTDAISNALSAFFEASSVVLDQAPVQVSWGDSAFDDAPGFDSPLINDGHDVVVAAFADDPESFLEVSAPGPDGMPKRYPVKEMITWEWMDAAEQPRRGDDRSEPWP
jgi:hypothetical protein